MAIVKHIKSRNANYSAAINYLLFEHDEKTGKKIVDESGNIHTHIVINSVRKTAVERQPYMDKPHEEAAGYKHRSTDKFMNTFKETVMDRCQQEGLHQIDLLAPAERKITQNPNVTVKPLTFRMEKSANYPYHLLRMIYSFYIYAGTASFGGSHPNAFNFFKYAWIFRSALN